MLFNSVAFLIFLPLVVLGYFLIPLRFRWLWLLAASYFFYGYWRIEYLALMLASTLLDFYLSNAIDRTQDILRRKLYLMTSIFGNLGLLFTFKYLGLFVDPINETTYNMTLGEHNPMYEAAHFIFYALPVGISFYTFQTMSYTIDIYYGRCKPETHLGKFALFVSYFPQLVAGPIERFNHLQPQLQALHKPEYKNFSHAFRLLLFGFFVKMCIADNVAQWANAVYTAPQNFDGVSVWFGVFIFGIQIYADFSGYSLIAQGAALMMGIKLMDNFRTPYLAGSIHEFWQRWHISLSTWFRDYVYIPLGGSKVRIARWVVNIFAVFLLSGFWHGANWTFLIWGGIHGGLYLLERFGNYTGLPQKIPALLRRPLGIMLTFFIVHIAWIFFRIEHVEDFGTIIHNLMHPSGTETLIFPTAKMTMLVLFILFDFMLLNTRFDRWVGHRPVAMRWAIYLILIFCILSFGGVTNHPFIYFQF